MTASRQRVMLPRMRIGFVVLAVLLSACRTTPTFSETSPTPVATPTPTASAASRASPTRYPGSVVRMTINGVEHP